MSPDDVGGLLVTFIVTAFGLSLAIIRSWDLFRSLVSRHD